MARESESRVGILSLRIRLIVGLLRAGAAGLSWALEVAGALASSRKVVFGSHQARAPYLESVTSLGTSALAPAICHP